MRVSVAFRPTPTTSKEAISRQGSARLLLLGVSAGNLVEIDGVIPVERVDLLDLGGLPSAHFEIVRDDARSGLKVLLEVRAQQFVRPGLQIDRHNVGRAEIDFE